MASILSRPQCAKYLHINYLNKPLGWDTWIETILWFKLVRYHIEAETKWPPIRKRCFKMHFFSMKIFEFRLIFHCILFLRVQLASIGSDNGLAPSRRQAIIWTKWWWVYRRIYASLGLNELNSLAWLFAGALEYTGLWNTRGLVTHIESQTVIEFTLSRWQL